MYSRRRINTFAAYTIATIGSIVAPVSAQAQPAPPKFEFKERDEEQEKLDQVQWKAQVQAGLVVTTGNSRTSTITAGGSASRKHRRDRFELKADAAYARSEIFLAVDENGDGFIEADEISRPAQTTTRSWSVKGRYDRFLTDFNSLYLTALASADRPAGKELLGSGQAGYSRQLLKKERHELVAEVGYDFSYEKYVTADDGVAIHSGRGFVGYTGKLRGATGLKTSVETLVNVNELDAPGGRIDRFEDTRVTGQVDLTTELFDNVSFSFSFTARFDNAPAPRAAFDLPYAPGFVPLADELDTITKATLIVNLL